MPRFGDDWSSFPAARPIRVEGGITTSKQRGEMAESWWSQRFIAVLESYGLGGRMQRGRRYARTGQVMTLSIEPGRLDAVVQGSRSTPYAIVIEVDQPNEAQWSALDDAFRGRIGFAARLLAGEVPPDLEAVFEGVGVSLFPQRWRDMDATCTCPDDANPCKHIAAVLYVLADQLDNDPWLLLTWRGRTREQILSGLSFSAALNAVSGPAVSGPAVSRRDRLPPWWPLSPDRVAAGTPRRPSVPAPLPPDPPDRVLERMAAFESKLVGPELAELLRPAYRALLPGGDA